jgi:hypothetical protein
MIDFKELQNIYNQQIDLLLADNGLTTLCEFNFGTSKNNICINCIYDPILKKSSNKYKTGGPVPFDLGKICPYCNGIGFYGLETKEQVYLAIIWDNKKWINPPLDIKNSDNFIQTICDKKLFYTIKKCKSMTIIYNNNNSNPIYSLYRDPTPAGLGDNNYLFSFWQKTGLTPSSV